MKVLQAINNTQPSFGPATTHRGYVIIGKGESYSSPPKALEIDGEVYTLQDETHQLMCRNLNLTARSEPFEAILHKEDKTSETVSIEVMTVS